MCRQYCDKPLVFKESLLLNLTNIWLDRYSGFVEMIKKPLDVKTSSTFINNRPFYKKGYYSNKVVSYGNCEKVKEILF